MHLAGKATSVQFIVRRTLNAGEIKQLFRNLFVRVLCSLSYESSFMSAIPFLLFDMFCLGYMYFPFACVCVCVNIL